jgi:NAD-dependent SIR2 family protein deacetylase
MSISSDAGFVTMRSKSGTWDDAVMLSQKKLGGSWLTSVDYSTRDPQMWATGTLSGEVTIFSRQGQYHKKVKAIVHRVKLLPSFDTFTYVAVATRGKGLIVLNAAKMSFENSAVEKKKR